MMEMLLLINDVTGTFFWRHKCFSQRLIDDVTQQELICFELKTENKKKTFERPSYGKTECNSSWKVQKTEYLEPDSQSLLRGPLVVRETLYKPMVRATNCAIKS